MVPNVCGSHTEDSSLMEVTLHQMGKQFHTFQSIAVPSSAWITPLGLSDPEDEGTMKRQELFTQ